MKDLKVKDMMYVMFIDNDIITTKQLISIGLTSKDLTKLVEEGKLKRLKVVIMDLK